MSMFMTTINQMTSTYNKKSKNHNLEKEMFCRFNNDPQQMKSMPRQMTSDELVHCQPI